MIEQPAAVAATVQGEAVSIGPAAGADSVIWTAKLRTGRAATFRVSVSRAFRAAALIALVAAVVDLAGIGSAVEAASAVIALVAVADLAGSGAVAGSGAGDDN
jgi:hypothetical protein